MKSNRKIYEAPDIELFELVTEQAFAESNMEIDDWGEEILGEW